MTLTTEQMVEKAKKHALAADKEMTRQDVANNPARAGAHALTAIALLLVITAESER